MRLKLADLFFDAEVLEHSLDCDALLSNLHVDRENLEYSELEKYQLQHELIRSNAILLDAKRLYCNVWRVRASVAGREPVRKR